MVRRLLLSAAAVAAVLTGVPPAFAHTELVSSTPAAGAATPAQVGVVELVFSERVQPDLSSVVVTGPDGEQAASGQPTADGARLVQPVEALLAAGSWTVAYRVLAADGHPVTGSLTFRVEASTGPPAPAPTGAPAPPAENGSSAGARDETGSGGPLTGGVLAAGGLTLAAAAGIVAGLRGRRSARGVVA